MTSTTGTETIPLDGFWLERETGTPQFDGGAGDARRAVTGTADAIDVAQEGMS